jgi:hypothetical protein
MLSCVVPSTLQFFAWNAGFDMNLRVLTRKAKMQLIPGKEDICELLFTHDKTCRSLTGLNNMAHAPAVS